MMPSDELRVTRWAGVCSVIVMVFGGVLALYVLQMRTSSAVHISGTLALAVLWLTNLVSTLLTALYWFFRRSPHWLTVALGVQVAAVIIPLAALVIMNFTH